MSGYVKTFKVKYEYKDTNNKLMSCCIDVEKLLKKYKPLSIKIKDLKSITLNTLPVYDDRYGKNKKKHLNSIKVNTNFRGLNVAEDDIECEAFTVIPIGSLPV